MIPTPLGHRRAPAPRSRPQGVALLEALIAILIFAFGVLGIVGLQSSMTRAQTSSKFRGDASYLVSELLGTMWSDIPNLAAYDTASGNCNGYARCVAWKAKVQTVLPGGTPVIQSPDGAAGVTVTLTWSVPGEGAHNYQTSTSVLAAQ
jgi:type IV pilus assembly protein PilV